MERPIIKLPAELTIAQVEECKSKILQQVENSDVILLDDSEVVRIDTVGIQLLLALVTHVSAQNKELQWQSCSPVIQESVKQLGLDEAILSQYLQA